MIKLCLDENLNRKLAASLHPVFRSISFTSVHAEGLLHEEDIPLFHELSARGINGLVTLDRNQLHGDERQALRESGLHWIGLPHPVGRLYQLQAQVVSTVVSGIRSILDEGFKDAPHMYMMEKRSLADLNIHSEPL